MTEFELIHHYFQQHAHGRSDVVLGSGDDCALLKPPKDQLLATSIDMMLEGVHFFPGTPAEDIAYKSLAISLSDLAAMGAEPAWVLATLSLPSVDEPWLEAFAKGFFEQIDRYGLALVGGDMVKGPLSVTTQVMGFVPPGKAIKRVGVKPGDKIYVTGSIGDARFALEQIREGKTPDEYFLDRLRRPTPRIKEGLLLRDVASAAIDISDGLMGDLRHLLEHDHLGAEINFDDIPTRVEGDNLKLVLSSGDDYELCFTVPPEKVRQLEGVDCACIGEVTEGDVRVICGGEQIEVDVKGWEHF